MANLNALQLSKLMTDAATRHGAKLTFAQIATGVSIMLAESAGNPSASHVNSPGLGIDRGLWQLNSIAHSNITDAQAFDPVQSTEAVYNLTNGFQITSFNAIWVDHNGTKSKGLDPVNIAAAGTAIVNELGGSAGGDIGGVLSGDTSIGQVASDASNGVGAVAGAITPDWAASLGRLLANLLDATWWKRVGVAALGIGVVIVALVLIFKNEIESEATGGIIPSS